jgi:8-oxo-dGTP pyrophosphatase MutT (NUDIX family)
MSLPLHYPGVMNPLDFDTLRAHLRTRLQAPLPGLGAQLTMAPPYRAELMRQVMNHTWRDAGVLVGITPGPVGPALILTLRRDDLKHHAGQVSFPGGAVDPDETPDGAAVREAFEEVGIEARHIEIMGALSPLHVPPSGFCVYSFVAAVGPEASLTACDSEVACIIKAPLSDFLDTAGKQHHSRVIAGTPVRVPHYNVDGHIVWGATAMIIAELVSVINGTYLDS